MNCFDVSARLEVQGADKDHLARVLEALHNENVLPTWGEGQTGAELTIAEIVAVIIGATSPQSECAATHYEAVTWLTDGDGAPFGEYLAVVMSEEPHRIGVEEIVIASNAQSATIRYSNGTSIIFRAAAGLKPFYNGCIIRGSLLAAIAQKFD